jgi:hypothetical protein
MESAAKSAEEPMSVPSLTRVMMKQLYVQWVKKEWKVKVKLRKQDRYLALSSPRQRKLLHTTFHTFHSEIGALSAYAVAEDQ